MTQNSSEGFKSMDQIRKEYFGESQSQEPEEEDPDDIGELIASELLKEARERLRREQD